MCSGVQEPILGTIESYNASVVNFHIATDKLARVECFINALTYYNAGVVAVNSKVV
jgi:hypothetical protein